MNECVLWLLFNFLIISITLGLFRFCFRSLNKRIVPAANTFKKLFLLSFSFVIHPVYNNLIPKNK